VKDALGDGCQTIPEGREHPDNRETGSEERFKALVKYRDEALKYLEERR